jgi:hypothetical protein
MLASTMLASMAALHAFDTLVHALAMHVEIYYSCECCKATSTACEAYMQYAVVVFAWLHNSFDSTDSNAHRVKRFMQQNS